MAKLPEGRSTLTDEQMIGLTHRLVDTCIDCKGRIEELEAKLAKAVEALTAWKYYDESDEQDHVSLMLNYADAIEKTRTTLAELTSSEAAYGEAKGGKDE